MKFKLLVYQEKFTITKKEVEEFFEWSWLSEPEIKTKEDVEKRLFRLRKELEWKRKIGEKYSEAFLHCQQWQLNSTTRDITIKKF